MWVLSKNKDCEVEAAAIKIENDNDIVVESIGGTKHQMGNYDSYAVCQKIVREFNQSIKRGDKVYELPKIGDHYL